MKTPGRQITILSFFITLLLITISGTRGHAQDAAGKWQGKLLVPAPSGNVSLTVVFNISEKEGRWSATLDSPDQGATGIPTDSTNISNDEVTLVIRALKVRYTGKITDSKTMQGTFTQGSISLPLDLEKIAADCKTEEEDESAKPYTSTEVKFHNTQENVTLAGTVTMPKNRDNCPAIVLVSGSGPQNRDEQLLGHKPFKRIADYLSSRGIAVLRYDDRGVGASAGDFASATTLNLYTDAIAAVNYLKTYKGIDTSRIGILGHSEGGLIALMAAGQHKADFIVSLAGPVIAGDRLLLLQSEYIAKAEGTSEKDISDNLTLSKKFFKILENQPDDELAKKSISAEIEKSDMSSDVKAEVMKNINGMPLLWLRTFISVNPAVYLASTRCPALFLFGEKDLQVPAAENEAAFQAVIKNKKHGNFTLTTVKGVNHLFQKADTGLMNEYANTENAAINDETLETIASWLQHNVIK